ncbi:MAG TPA: Uma2 family endonuclease [Gammaproteobacteria bacterium]
MHDLVFESTRTVTPKEFAEFVATREAAGDTGHYELLNGRVVMSPPAGYPHGEIGSNVQRVLASFVWDRKLGRVFDSSQGFELPSGDTVEPDHAFVSHERRAAAPAPEAGRFLRVVPDLIVEVMSGRTASQDRGEKKAIYERNGVLEYWLLDPRAEEVTVFHALAGRFDGGSVYAVTDRLSSQVLAGLTIDVRDLMPLP